MIIYAFGDVHGMDEQLRMAMEAVESHAKKHSSEEKLAVFLGDYVDRGQSSMQVVDMIRGWDPGFKVIALRGNHEQMMVSWAQGIAHHWLESYPETVRSYRGDEEKLFEHVAWMAGLPLYHRQGNYLFVHAGIAPGIPLEDQDPGDLIWIRHPFLKSKVDHGFIVVHGHTPDYSCPEVKHNRINLDSGCFHTGRLTVGVLQEGSAPSFITAKGDPVR